MPTMQDTDEGWQMEFPGKRTNPYRDRDVVESGPEIDTLYDRAKTTYKPVVLWVEYEANNPVTITWRVDGTILGRMRNRVRQSSTSLRLSRRWLRQYPDSTYTVTVRDQDMDRKRGVNPMSTSCNVSIDPDN